MMTTAVNRKKKAGTPPMDADREKRRAALDAARGSLAWVKYSVDDFIRDKRVEVERENAE